jgi:hypothetical protein
MASHTKSELRWAAGVLARAVHAVADQPKVQRPAVAQPVEGVARVYDGVAEAA